MNAKQIGALPALVATMLMLVNMGPAFADAKTSGDKYTVSMLEKKQAKEASKMIKTLEEYKNTLKQHKFDNKNTEKRIADKTNSIENKIGGIVSMLKSKVQVQDTSFSTPSVEIMAVNKLRSSMSDDVGIARVVYKATAGDVAVLDAKVVIDSGVERLENQIRNLSASKSTVHTVYMKVANPSSVSILVTQ